MNARMRAQATRADGGRQWARGLALMLAAGVVAILPAAARLRRGLRDLRCIRATYALKVSWAGNRDELERRVREQGAAMAALDARLLAAADVPRLTRAINAAARETGCAVLSTRPAQPMPLPRPQAKGKAPDDAAAFAQWRVRVELQGAYAQLSALLARLGHETWHLRIRRLVLQPNGEDREALHCELELVGYGLGPPAGKG